MLLQLLQHLLSLVCLIIQCGLYMNLFRYCRSAGNMTATVARSVVKWYIGVLVEEWTEKVSVVSHFVIKLTVTSYCEHAIVLIQDLRLCVFCFFTRTLSFGPKIFSNTVVQLCFFTRGEVVVNALKKVWLSFILPNAPYNPVHLIWWKNSMTVHLVIWSAL